MSTQCVVNKILGAAINILYQIHLTYLFTFLVRFLFKCSSHFFAGSIIQSFSISTVVVFLYK